MGTKVQSKSYFPGYYSMRDLNEDSNSCSWPLFCGDKTLTNGQYYNGYLPRAGAYSGYDKDVVKQTMLEHEAIFKKQVSELHRLYRIQRDLMDEIKRKELHQNRISVETSLSSSPLASQITSEDARRWRVPSFPVANCISTRPSISAVEDIYSPYSSMQGNNAQVSLLASQNGCTSKDIEVLESRPAKVRRKLIDLQLPADEYIDDEGEQMKDETLSGLSSSFPNGNQKMPPESGVKLFHGDGVQTDCQRDVLRSDSVRSTNNLADLNEPIPVEDTKTSSFADLLSRASCHGGVRSHEPCGKPKPGPFELPKEMSLDSHHESSNGAVNNQQLENGRGWFAHVLESGKNKSNLKSVSQGLPPNILSNKAHESPPSFLTDQSKADMWGERKIRGLDISERSHEISNYSHAESVVASNMPSPYPIAPSSDLAKSWSPSVSSWEKPSSCLNHKSISAQTHPCLNSSGTLSKSPQSSPQSHGIFGDRWHHNSIFRLKPSDESESSNRNGFYHGSSSGSKEHPICIPSARYEYLNSSNDHNLTSEQFSNHGSIRVYKDSKCMDMKFAKDVNLNVTISNRSSDEAVPRQNLEILEDGRKHEDPIAVLPWVKAPPACNNKVNGPGRNLNTNELSFLQSSLSQLAKKNESGKDPTHLFGQNVKSVSCSSIVEAGKIEINDCPSSRKILGVPILDEPCIFKNNSSRGTLPSAPIPRQAEEVKNDGRNRLLDINLPCEPAVPDSGQQIEAENVVMEKGKATKEASFRHQIDLNLCVSEDEAYLISPVPSTSVKRTSGIDLEAPVVFEAEEDGPHGEEPAEMLLEAPLPLAQRRAEQQDESMRIAAEAIVSISSCNLQSDPNNVICDTSEVPLRDPLQWFVDIVSCCGEELENKYEAIVRMNDGENSEESASEDTDYFESMTLKLTEATEEEYMPKPLVPENIKLEETGPTVIPSRPRKGQARRGRQRRDFQRDILPGLASLSRHEVTEDLQTFGGLMKATGHAWSGLTRRNSTRNGCVRGRRRTVASPSPVVAPSGACPPLIQQFNNIEVTLEDRSLTGWGKTTRRPRRQRCPAGNPPAVPLT